MGTSASIGFFGPTNKENAVGGKQSNFSTSEPVERPKFEPKKPKKRKVISNSDAKNDPTPPTTRDDGHPSDTCWKQLPPLSKARPKDFFDTQLTPAFMDWAVRGQRSRKW
jgi:hypothetical protein